MKLPKWTPKAISTSKFYASINYILINQESVEVMQLQSNNTPKIVEDVNDAIKQLKSFE